MLYFRYDTKTGAYIEDVLSDGFYKEVPRMETVTELDEDGEEIQVGREVFDLVPYMPDGITDVPIPRPMYDVWFDRDKQMWVETGSPPQPDIEALRSAKKSEIGSACTEAIYAGVEVDGKHYSLNEHDQIELMAQYAEVKAGAEAVPYHADGELCRMYSADEFGRVAKEATAHIFYNRTYCNHVNKWIARADTDELSGIVYGCDLPDDLRDNMLSLLSQVGGDSA